MDSEYIDTGVGALLTDALKRIKILEGKVSGLSRALENLRNSLWSSQGRTNPSQVNPYKAGAGIKKNYPSLRRFP